MEVRFLEGALRYVFRVVGIQIPPEGVVKAIDPHLHHHQEIGLSRLPDVFCDGEVLFRRCAQPLEQRPAVGIADHRPAQVFWTAYRLSSL